MSAVARIEAYFKDLPQGCCPNMIYALVFNQANQALKLNAGVYSYDNFSAAALDDFKIELSEHAQRSKFYYADLAALSVASLPDTPHDEPWWIEFWLKEGAGGRSVDTLYEVRPAWWQGGRLAWFVTSLLDVSNLVTFKSHVAVSYDSALNKLRFVGWLERNGQRVIAETCAIKWLMRDGTTIADFIIPSSMSSMPGMFQSEQAITDIVPDEATPVEVSLLYNGTTYVSFAGVASWD